MERMKISVIVPTYKPQDYLWECLNSLTNQTFSKNDFELILVLNGCNEPYKSDIDNYLEQHSDLNVNFIQLDQGGVSNARNIGLDNAKGEYIAFIDDDDYVSPSYLEELYAKVAQDTIAICYPYFFNDGFPEKQLKYPMTDIFNKMRINGKQNFLASRKFFGGPCMKLVSRCIIADRRFDVRFKNSEDSIFMFLISDKFKNVDYTSEKAVYYRRNRKDSAVNRKRSLMKCMCDNLSVAREYIIINFKGQYNFKFFITRILAAFKNIVIH